MPATAARQGFRLGSIVTIIRSPWHGESGRVVKVYPKGSKSQGRAPSEYLVRFGAGDEVRAYPFTAYELLLDESRIQPGQPGFRRIP